MFSFFNNKNNNKRVYLDYAGATKMGERAKRALFETQEIFGNPSAVYKEGVDAKNLLDDSRKKIGDLINARKHEIYFTGSGTESCNLAIFGTYHAWKKESHFAEATRDKIPHIIVSAIEHPAVMEVITNLAINNLANITLLPVYENGLVKVQDLREAITKETILVSVMYANNEIGTIQPIKEIGRAIEEFKRKNKSNYPLFHTDACQAGNYLNLDVFRLKVDMMTINSSKVYGPKGIGVLYKKEGVNVSPVILGGGQERNLRSGTESASLAYAFAVALEEAIEIKEKEVERLINLRDKFKEKLSERITGIKFYGDFENRLPNNINCSFPGMLSDEMIIRLDQRGFAVSHKSACASATDDSSYVIKALGKSDTEAKENVRITLGRDTEWKDLERLISVIEEIYKKFKK